MAFDLQAVNPDLHAISPLDGRYAAEVEPLRAFFSEEALIRYRIRVELRYLAALTQRPEIPVRALPLPLREELEARPALIARVKEFELETRHDVKAVEYTLAEALRHAGHDELVNWLHWGLTSEDVNNLSYALMLTEACQQVILPQLKELLLWLSGWIRETAEIPMLARTHGQAASPTTVGKEYAVFANRLLEELKHFQTLLPLGGKLNGATGNWHLFQSFFPNEDWPAFSSHLIRSLGLEPKLLTTQIVVRESYARVLDSLHRMSQIAIDLCRDSWQYISLGYFRLRPRSSTEVGSSTMPHKVNPVLFENAEGNLELASALLAFFSTKLLKSRLQRDLSDSTVLRNLGVAFGHILLARNNLQRGLAQLQPVPERMLTELSQHWEVLAEPLQHALRLRGQAVPYDLIRKHTQGLQMGAEAWQALLDELKIDLPIERPDSYIGLAVELAHRTNLALDAYLHAENA